LGNVNIVLCKILVYINNKVIGIQRVFVEQSSEANKFILMDNDAIIYHDSSKLLPIVTMVYYLKIPCTKDNFNYITTINLSFGINIQNLTYKES